MIFSQLLLRTLFFFPGVLMLFATSGAGAQPFPNRPITLISPWPAGSAGDLSARAIADGLVPILKQPVIVDNKPGAGQAIAAIQVARARPDGYTLMLVALPSVMTPSALAAAPFKGMKDFAPVADVLTLGVLLGASTEVPAKNLKEFIALLKANPEKYSFASAGVGSPLHLVSELFNSQVGVKPLHIPVRGAPQVAMELVSKRVTYGFVTLDAMQFVQDGRLKVFGLGEAKRNAFLPEVPTLDEAGLKGFQAGLRHIMLAPKGLPADVAALINRAINDVITTEKFALRVKSIGVPAQPLSLDQVGASLARDEDRWNALVKSANIQLE